MEDSFLKQMTEPLFFDAYEFGRALERYAEDNPHQTKDSLDGNGQPSVDGPLFNMTKSEPMPVDAKSAADFPDASDEIMTDYAFRRLMGEEVEIPKFVDLDTSKDFVKFTQNSLGSSLASEREFDSGVDQSLTLLTEIKDILSNGQQ